MAKIFKAFCVGGVVPSKFCHKTWIDTLYAFRMDTHSIKNNIRILTGDNRKYPVWHLQDFPGVCLNHWLNLQKTFCIWQFNYLRWKRGILELISTPTSSSEMHSNFWSNCYFMRFGRISQRWEIVGQAKLSMAWPLVITYVYIFLP